MFLVHAFPDTQFLECGYYLEFGFNLGSAVLVGTWGLPTLVGTWSLPTGYLFAFDGSPVQSPVICQSTASMTSIGYICGHLALV